MTDTLFQPVRDRYGVRLALVFGNHSRDGICPYYAAGKCHHCDIGAGEGRAFTAEQNLQRLDDFERRYAALLPEVSHLIVYNSGSVLNPRELPPPLLSALLRRVRRWPALRVLSLDTREPYLTLENVRRVAADLPDGAVLRPILGLESADDRIRNEILQKAMPLASVRRGLQALGLARRELQSRLEVGVDVNVVVAGPGTTAETAVADVVQTVRVALEWGIEWELPVDFNLHAYYPSLRGRTRFPDHPRCSVSLLRQAAVAARAAAPAASGIFIGYQDEGHDLEQHLRAAELVSAGAAFDRFNESQDPALLA